MNYMKNSSDSVFKWPVAWKWGLPRPKVSYECLSPSTTPKSCDQKILECPDVPEGPLRVLFRFHSGRVFLRFLSDRILLKVLSDRAVLRVIIERVLFESPLICFYSGSSVIDSSLGSTVLFFRHAAIFYQNMLLTCYYVLF